MHYERLGPEAPPGRARRAALLAAGGGAAALACLALGGLRAGGWPAGRPERFEQNVATWTASSKLEASSTDSKVACLNPVVSTGTFQLSEAGGTMLSADRELDGWKLVQATDMQRHGDRWLYRHDNIGNVCWPKQVNSSDPRLAEQCDFNRSSIWSAFKHDADPYSAPLKGHCDLMQITVSGLRHSRRLGEIFKAEYGHQGRHPLPGVDKPLCAPGSVFLASDAVQKNERTVEEVYHGFCGRPPSVNEFPAESVLVHADPILKGSPFWLKPGICGGFEFDAFAREAAAAQKATKAYAKEARQLAITAAALNGHDLPASVAGYRPFLSGLIDCAVCHSCLGLDDVPEELLNSRGLPDEDGLFGRLDRMETAGVVWPYLYFKSQNETAFVRYAQLHYGYYFVVLLDRLQAAVDAIARQGQPEAEGLPAFFIQVMSDTNISPQLVMLGLGAEAAARPQWLATLVTELWTRGSGPEAEFAVRTLYNGRVQRPCPGQRGALCPWPAFRALLAKFAPERQACPRFYDNYDFISSFKQS